MNSTSCSYPWYTQVDSAEPIQQGDFVLKCQIIQPSVEAERAGQSIKAIVKEYDVIVMSQSCDLVNDKIDLVLWKVGNYMSKPCLNKIHSKGGVW